jgi:hypothetical protein
LWARNDRPHQLLLVTDPALGKPETFVSTRSTSALILIDVHLQLDLRLAYARYFDHVFVAQADYLPAFRALGHPSVHALPLACDPATHFAPGLKRDLDVGFVGKFGLPGSQRARTLQTVLSAFKTNDTARFYSPEEMGAVYSRAKIVFNKSINGDLNMRFFEALGAGALLVTDRIGNGMSEIATEGEHFVAYDTAEEAIDVIRRYLADEPARAAIAQRGHQHALAHHTYAHRLAKVLETVAANPTARAPARDAPAKLEAVWRTECLRIQGAPLPEIARTLWSTPLSASSARNAAIAGLRGIVRPWRQRQRRATAIK